MKPVDPSSALRMKNIYMHYYILTCMGSFCKISHLHKIVCTCCFVCMLLGGYQTVNILEANIAGLEKHFVKSSKVAGAIVCVIVCTTVTLDPLN